MNGPQIVLCSIADEELSSVIRDYGFELYRDFTEVPAKKSREYSNYSWGRGD